MMITAELQINELEEYTHFSVSLLYLPQKSCQSGFAWGTGGKLNSSVLVNRPLPRLKLKKTAFSFEKCPQTTKNIDILSFGRNKSTVARENLTRTHQGKILFS